MKIGAKAHAIKKRNWALRFLKSKADAAELEGLVKEINTSMSEFIVSFVRIYDVVQC